MTQPILPGDVDTIIHSALNPPGANTSFYTVTATTNRDIIHQLCPGKTPVDLLLIFKQYDYVPLAQLTHLLEQARSRAIGIASNHANLTAASLGYRAGFTQGQDLEQEPCLILGIGTRVIQVSNLERSSINQLVLAVRSPVPIHLTKLI